jgi:DNA-binding GntR family transcriptional regulator
VTDEPRSRRSTASEPSTSGDSLRTTTLVDGLADSIHAAILNGVHPIGSRLRQEALAATFGVSRTPIREALRKLEAAGVLELVANQGAVVRGPTPRAIREAYFVRAELEGLAVELATSRITDEGLLRLKSADQQFGSAVRDYATRDPATRGSVDPELANAWSDANNEFHEIIQLAAGNERLQKTISELHLLFPRSLTWSALSTSLELLSENLEEHRRIRLAIERREPATARLHMTYHVHRAGELVAQWWERQRTED